MNFYRRPQPKLYVPRPNERARRPILLILLAVLALVLLLTAASRAREREINLYHAHKVGISAVRITCDEGLKPHVVTDPATLAVLGNGGVLVVCTQ
jgi:hypothetical protein